MIVNDSFGYRVHWIRATVSQVQMHACLVTAHLAYTHRRRSGWNSGGTHGEGRRWIGAEWGGVCGGVSPLQPTRGSGGASWAPPAGPGRFLKATERSFLYLYDKICGGQFALSSPLLQILGGTCPPVSPVIYAHAYTLSSVEQTAYCFCGWYEVQSVSDSPARRWDRCLAVWPPHVPCSRSV